MDVVPRYPKYELFMKTHRAAVVFDKIDSLTGFFPSFTVYGFVKISKSPLQSFF